MFDKEKNIAICSDHGGYDLKEFLKKELEQQGYLLVDYGCFSNESVDYPDIVHPLAEAVSNNKFEFGIIMCGSGNGIQMAANKHRNVRAALCWDIEQTKLCRMHNNANILSLAGRFIEFNLALQMTEIFINTPFEGGRHQLRVEKISKF
ncbi:MAG: ribose 5-phosphate isomerase B [Bacteroidales bacterium]